MPKKNHFWRGAAIMSGGNQSMASAGVQLTPGATVSVLTLAGVDLNHWIIVGTFILVVLQIAIAVRNLFSRSPRPRDKPEDDDDDDHEPRNRKRRRQRGAARARLLVATMVLSAGGFATWVANEGFTERPVIPTQGDVPTIGHGSTRYEDGTPVRMSDPPITRERAARLARNLASVDERRLQDSLPGVRLHQEEFDVYVDFVGQYGIGNWRQSSMRRHLLAGRYREACDALLRYRYAAGYDCSTPGNRRCMGVWTRQQKRHAQCLAAQ